MATEEVMSKKRLRKANWTPDETLHLAQCFRAYAHVLSNDFSKAGCSKKARADAWRAISEEVAAVSGIPRTENECQKRWQISKRKPSRVPPGRGRQ